MQPSAPLFTVYTSTVAAVAHLERPLVESGSEHFEVAERADQPTRALAWLGFRRLISSALSSAQRGRFEPARARCFAFEVERLRHRLKEIAS